MLLALDTASQRMGVALYDGVEVLAEKVWRSPNYHTAQLAPLVAQILEQSHSTVSALRVVAVTVGPGGFTGLRVGMALAKGIALAASLDYIGIPALDALAFAQPLPCKDGFRMAAVLQAGRGRLAVGWYELGESGDTHAVPNQESILPCATWQLSSLGYEIMTAGSLADRIADGIDNQGAPLKTFVCGELDAQERHILLQQARRLPAQTLVLASPAQSLRRPSFLAELAWHRWQRGEIDNPATNVPIYLYK